VLAVTEASCVASRFRTAKRCGVTSSFGPASLLSASNRFGMTLVRDRASHDDHRRRLRLPPTTNARASPAMALPP
jgi:hypothetical protein